MTVDGEIPLWQEDATALLARFRDGTALPSDVLDTSLSRIERINPMVNAVVSVSNTAREEAALSDARWRSRSPLGPLDGVPMVVKDNLLVAGMPATFGSPVYAGIVPPADELPIRRLREAGAILLGKANCPEFALEGYTANALHGVTRNPYDRDVTPGGSSGGSVAAVAAGLVPLAIGTDGGGSLRRPAAYTHLFGLKPTVGSVARDAALPQLLLDFEVVGPFARSVRDLRLAYDVLAQSGPEHPTSRRTFMAASGRGAPGRWRILYCDRIGDNPCDPAIREACRKAAAVFAGLGHEIEYGTLPFPIDTLNEVWPLIGQVALADLRRQNPGFDRFASAKYRAMADAGEAVPAHRLYRVLEIVTALRRHVSTTFTRYDAILTPTCAAMPWAADEAYPSTIDGCEVGPRGHAVYTAWVNAAHHPAVAVPTGAWHGGLPIGFQLIGAFGSESSLLDLAESYEARCLPSRSWPSCAA